MPDPLILYSANTLLAYRINQEYYQQKHFVWCNPCFSATASSIDVQMPPSSMPCEICRTLHEDVSQQDLHSDRVKRNREEVLRGAKSKRAAGVVREDQFQEIERIIAGATLADFRPLLYIIPLHLVADRVQTVLPARRAHPFSREYIIEDLPRSGFDVVEWFWR